MCFSLKWYSASVITCNNLIASICWPLGISDILLGFGKKVEDRPGIREIEDK